MTRSGACSHAPPRVLQHRTLLPNQGELQGCHMSCGSGSHLLDRKGSGAATCTVALNPASLQGRALMHYVYRSSRPCLLAREGSSAPHVLQLRNLSPCRGELQCATCPIALDPASQQGRASVLHVSYSSGSYLLVGEGSEAPRVLRLWILPPYQEGFGATTVHPAVPCRLQASNIKKSLACLPMWLGPYVSNVCMHASKTPDVRAIMILQDMWASSTDHACKMCGHAATVRL
jgi:hypothetical protein